MYPHEDHWGHSQYPSICLMRLQQSFDSLKLTNNHGTQYSVHTLPKYQEIWFPVLFGATIFCSNLWYFCQAFSCLGFSSWMTKEATAKSLNRKAFCLTYVLFTTWVRNTIYCELAHVHVRKGWFVRKKRDLPVIAWCKLHCCTHRLQGNTTPVVQIL